MPQVFSSIDECVDRVKRFHFAFKRLMQILEARLTAEGKVDLAILVELADPAGERITEGTVTVTLRRL